MSEYLVYLLNISLWIADEALGVINHEYGDPRYFLLYAQFT